jgi:predicted alpha-1,2-mannosidase
MQCIFNPTYIYMKAILLFAAVLICSLAYTQNRKRIIDFVDPFIGTGGHGHTYPGVTLPFGMVQLSPDNGTQGWDWCSGYNYSDSVIAGFSHTHLSGTGIGDLCDISVMPTTTLKNDTLAIRTPFSHNKEVAQPGYYGVYLKQEKIWAELTATPHCGMHKYTFPASKTAQIRLDLGFAINWDKATLCSFKQINDSTFIGFRESTGWSKKQFVAFAIVVSKKIKNLKLYENKTLTNATESSAKDVMACLNFDTKEGEQILMKVGISFTDVNGALNSLKEIPVWNFDLVKNAAQTYWEKELGNVLVQSGDINFLKTFYTALYHSFLAPNTFTDYDYNYSIKGAKIVNAKGRNRYSVHSLWDTFRAANPLFTLTQTERLPDIINSYINFYDNIGLLPVWDLYFNETNTMTGYHAVPIIADAIIKGIPNFDIEKAYGAMKVSSNQKQRGTQEFIKYGYLPQDKHGWSVTITLEYAYDDWCIAQVAEYLGRRADYDEYMKRAASYKNLFDAKTGFFRAKNSDGKFVEPFDPIQSEHGFDGQYIEGTAWQHSFFVPHDVEGMANLHGSRLKLIAKLDTLFSMSSKMTGKDISADISGLIGQYAHGNEPSHHIAYLYSSLGQPWKTAEKIRQITSTMYNATPSGLSGNEDCGQMSAWYVFSALGFYPLNPMGGNYVFGSPLVNGAILLLANGKKFNMKVLNNGPKNIYISKVKLNGMEYPYTYIKHADIVAGGDLEIEMSNKPNKKWGVDPKAAIPSMSASITKSK